MPYSSPLLKKGPSLSHRLRWRLVSPFARQPFLSHSFRCSSQFVIQRPTIPCFVTITANNSGLDFTLLFNFIVQQCSEQQVYSSDVRTSHECGAPDGKSIDTRNRSPLGKHSQVPLCAPQVAHNLGLNPTTVNSPEYSFYTWRGQTIMGKIKKLSLCLTS
jgi:hypothetical protein